MKKLSIKKQQPTSTKKRKRLKTYIFFFTKIVLQAKKHALSDKKDSTKDEVVA